MPRPRNSLLVAAAALIATLAGCGDAPTATATATAPAGAPPSERLGLLSSLPLYHPLGADVAAIASGGAAVPWQRRALERDWVLEPLDTLAPVPALSPGEPATDPLAGLTRLAVIQPRALTPQDNVALDDWVRGGGHLLLVLDPLLTGDYDLPLTDARHPAASALIPPVVKRWGMAVRFDEAQSGEPAASSLAGKSLPLVLAGAVTITDPAAGLCALEAGGAAARCRVGKGRVTLIADAALFEHADLAGQGGAELAAVVKAALD